MQEVGLHGLVVQTRLLCRVGQAVLYSLRGETSEGGNDSYPKDRLDREGLAEQHGA